MPVLSDVNILLAGYDRSGDHNAISIARDRDELDDTTFGSVGDRDFVVGIHTAQVEGKGRHTAGVGSIDEQIETVWPLAAQVITISSQGGADGDNADILAEIHSGSYEFGGAIGEILPFNLSAKVTGPAPRGTIMHNASRATSGNGTARQLGAVLSGQTIAASLHVLSVSGTSPTLDVTIESDAVSGMTSPLTQLTFTQATAIEGQFLTKVGAITDDWWRVAYTVGGTSPSFTFLVAIGIR